MTAEKLLQQYPTKKIKPFDGMVITAAVWEEAHNYHYRSQALHTLFGHGAGILTGLEVIANDPPDTALYILPGIAIDPSGQTIVLPQPVAYDIGHNIEGDFCLVLSYSESHLRSENNKEGDGSPVYINHEFSLAVQTTFNSSTGVELARIKRSSRESVLRNAKDPAFPDLDEIDLRFRLEVGAPPKISVAVSYLGNVTNPRQGRGATYLAQYLNNLGKYRVLVEDNVLLEPGIVTNTLIYLVGQGPFELNTGIINGLYNYVYRGKGTLFLESLDKAAEASFMEFLTRKNIKPDPIERGHRLLTHPHLFTAPPAGYPIDTPPRLACSDGVIFSPNNYGMVWQGERQGRLASREEIRSAIELGNNIITYALERKRLRGR